MRVFLKTFLVLLMILFGSSVMAFAAPRPEAKNASPQNADFRQCTDQRLQITFLCNPDWSLQVQDNNTMVIIISRDPLVTLTLGKSKTPISSLEQLSSENLQEIGQYASGFTREDIPLAGQKAIRVQGISKARPKVGFLDYYVIRKSNMYSILFSVSPKERWNDYAELFNKILGSISFVAPKK